LRKGLAVGGWQLATGLTARNNSLFLCPVSGYIWQLAYSDLSSLPYIFQEVVPKVFF
jgi:hypothetical protein